MKRFKRVLLVQPFGIGDALFITPVIRALKQAGVEKIGLLIGSRTAEVFQRHPQVDEIYVVDKDLLKQKTLWGKLAFYAGLFKRLRAARYEAYFDFSNTREYAAWIFFFVGVAYRAGFNYKNRGCYFTRKIEIPNGYSEKHVAEYYADLPRAAGIPVPDLQMDFYLKPEDEQQAEERLQALGVTGKFAVVAPGGGESWGKEAYFKQWSPRFFAQTANAMGEPISYEPVLILGSDKEKVLGEEFAKEYAGKSINLCGQTGLIESAALLKRAALLLANDGGLVHMARALRVPVVALYGPVDEKIYGPYPAGENYLAVGRGNLECRPCYQKFRFNSACEHRACLTELFPKEVFQEIAESGLLSRI